jgi:hypothetical protein
VSADDLLSTLVSPTAPVARSAYDLRAVRLSSKQWRTMTGMGLRNIPGCENSDSVRNKFLAGALSASGVCAVVFGTDSPEHYRGHA